MVVPAELLCVDVVFVDVLCVELGACACACACATRCVRCGGSWLCAKADGPEASTVPGNADAALPEDSAARMVAWTIGRVAAAAGVAAALGPAALKCSGRMLG